MKYPLILTLALFASFSANAEYIVKMALPKQDITFKQYYDNVGIDPSDDNTSTNNPQCLIKNGDFASYSGQLLRVTQEETLKCVVDIIVPKSLFDSECNSNAPEINKEIWDMMRSKGVDGVASIGFYGECA